LSWGPHRGFVTWMEMGLCAVLYKGGLAMAVVEDGPTTTPGAVPEPIGGIGFMT